MKSVIKRAICIKLFANKWISSGLVLLTLAVCAVYQINERSLGIVKVSLMEVVTGRRFSEAEMDPDVYATYFEGKNWDYFNPYEQIVIIGDTAYWCVF